MRIALQRGLVVGERLVEESAGGGEVPTPAGQVRQVEQCAGDRVAIIGDLGELGGEPLLNGQGLGLRRLGVLEQPLVPEQKAHVVVAGGQLLAELGPTWEHGNEVLLDRQALP